MSHSLLSSIPNEAPNIGEFYASNFRGDLLYSNNNWNANLI